MSGRSQPAHQREDTPSTDGDQPQDDLKAQFRKALERKQSKAKSGEKHADGSSKIHDAHGPAASRRTFRRKSG